MRRVLLDTGLEGRRVAWLRAPTGADELAARGGVDVLLDRCLEERDPVCVEPGTVGQLPVSDRDRLLVAMHRMLFGDHIEADAPCTACGESFSLRFSLTSLVDAERARRPRTVEGPDARGHYWLGDIGFRLPSRADLDAVCTLAEDERASALLRALVLSGDLAGREAEVEEAMAVLGPTLDVALEASCPHCASQQHPRFSMAAFLEKQLDNERRFLLREVHRMAAAYGWCFDTILGIPRTDRHELVGLIEGERAHGGQAWRHGELGR